MEQYELMVIFKPQLVDEEKQKPLGDLESLIKKHKGTITQTDDWGEKSLQHTIQGHERGYYVVYRLELDPEKVETFSQKLNLEKDILRWLLVMAEGELVVEEEEKEKDTATDTDKEKSES